MYVADSCTVVDATLDLPPSCRTTPVKVHQCNGSCGPDCPQGTDLCCDITTYHNDAITCVNTLALEVLVPDSCDCAPCSNLAFILKGRVATMDGSKPLKLGTVLCNGTAIAKTDYQGYFAISLPRGIDRVLLTFDNAEEFAKMSVDYDVKLEDDFLAYEFHVPQVSKSNKGYVMFDKVSVYLPQPAYVATVPVSKIHETFGNIRDQTSIRIKVCTVFYVDMAIANDIAMGTDQCPGADSIWRLTRTESWEKVKFIQNMDTFTWTHRDQKEWYAVGATVQDLCCISISVRPSLLDRVFPYTVVIMSSQHAASTTITEKSMSLRVPCGDINIFARREGKTKEVNINLQSENCEAVVDMTLLLHDEQTQVFRYNHQTTPHLLSVLQEEDSMMAWHPLSYKDIYSTCMFSVLLQCEGSVNVVAVSSSGTNPATQGRVYGVVEQRVEKGAGHLCVEFRCSGLSLTESEIEFTRLTTNVEDSTKCKLLDINNKLAHRFTNNGILLDHFTALMPVDAYGEDFGVFQGNSRLSVIDSYQMALSACKSSRGRYGVAFGLTQGNVDIDSSEGIVFED